MKKKIPVAIIYDFDGTLAPGNMQERNFIPAIGMNTKKFWKEVNEKAKSHQADNILIYMRIMLSKAASASVAVRKKDFKAFGKNLIFFNGILPYNENDTKHKGWFERINEYGISSGVKVEHYIVSSGIREMIAGTPISKKFKAILSIFSKKIDNFASQSLVRRCYVDKAWLSHGITVQDFEEKFHFLFFYFFNQLPILKRTNFPQHRFT